ncbi:TPA: ZmpA/ZmpB/ZmpC family metallo-endopeptidase [Streptococcus pneumoniae]
MEKYFGEKQERFSFRKLSVGLVSATISSLFFMSVLASSSVDAQETAGVHYKYVADSELSSEEKKQLVYDIPTYVENDDETYYLVYKLNSQNQLVELPNTGSKNERQALVAGASLAALGILIFAVSKKKVKNKTVLHLVLVAGMGNGVLVSVHALENHLLLNYNTDYELTSGEKLPLPKEISGYTYIGYIKEGKTTSDFEVSNQEKSAATPTKQQKVDYNVTPNFVDHPSTVQAIQEQTPVSSTKPTEVQVVEKPFSTKLINPRKEEKQSSDSQEQLAEHKNLETKKEEKISPKEKTGVNTLNPQDEVLSGQLNKPELLYREETIETKIDFQEEIQENPDLAEGTVRVKQEGKLGKKVEIVRIFSVNAEAKFDSSNPAMKNFFGPVGNKVVHNQHGAYATGDGVYYMSYRMLDKDGAITYTHEMTHDSDQDIYLGGYGRRSGLGPEFFAKGLLQAPDQPSDATITINSILKHSKSDSTEGSRLQVLDPTERFQNAADLQNYVHNMFDLIYMMEYLEGQSIVNKLSVYQKIEALRKIENQYLTDPADGNDVYATNVVKNLTEDEAKKLTSFDSLIDNNILSAREYKAGTYERNGYFTIKLFAPIFSALSGEKGTPGDLMGRRIAFELLAAKGFKDGMVPYISNQYEEDAKQQGQTINLYGKERGLVTDELVLKKVFDGKYKTWAEFKTAMYQERVDQFGNLKQVTFKDPTKPWPRYGTKTINNVDELQKLMDEAVLQDATGTRWSNYNPETDSAVHKLKRAIFKAYLDQTNDFRSSIFENKK